MSQADNQRDLRIFLDDGRQIRLVNDLGSGKLTGIAFKNPGDWDWQMVRVEGTEERLFREIATNLITKQLAQAVPGIDPPSSLDGALNKAEAILSPKIILSKIANAGAQVVAYHVGLGPGLGSKWVFWLDVACFDRVSFSGAGLGYRPSRSRAWSPVRSHPRSRRAAAWLS